MAELVNITGLDKAKVLQALWMHSKSQGVSMMGFSGDILTYSEASQYVNSGYCDYVNGRVIKVGFKKGDEFVDEFNPWGYDRDNGDGLAQEAVNDLKQNPDKYKDDDSLGRAFFEEMMGQIDWSKL